MNAYDMLQSSLYKTTFFQEGSNERRSVEINVARHKRGEQESLFKSSEYIYYSEMIKITNYFFY